MHSQLLVKTEYRGRIAAIRNSRNGSVALTAWLGSAWYSDCHDRSPALPLQTPAEIIAHAVWLHYCFPLSFRDVEDLLAERAIAVLFQTLAEWAAKSGL